MKVVAIEVEPMDSVDGFTDPEEADVWSVYARLDDGTAVWLGSDFGYSDMVGAFRDAVEFASAFGLPVTFPHGRIES